MTTRVDPRYREDGCVVDADNVVHVQWHGSTTVCERRTEEDYYPAWELSWLERNTPVTCLLCIRYDT